MQIFYTCQYSSNHLISWTSFLWMLSFLYLIYIICTKLIIDKQYMYIVHICEKMYGLLVRMVFFYVRIFLIEWLPSMLIEWINLTNTFIFLEYLMWMTVNLVKLTEVLGLVLQRVVLIKNIAVRFCMHSLITSSLKHLVIIFY